MIKNKIDHDLDIELTMLDIEELNHGALAQQYDVSKVSFSLLSKVAQDYWLLSSGSALGKACGPLLISKSLHFINPSTDYHCLIPGKLTTANFLLSTLYPQIQKKEETLFSEIESKLDQGIADLGLVIHETRFTYAENGFNKISDLGLKWEKLTGLPIPLGGIVAKRSLDRQLVSDVNILINKSIEYAYQNKEEALEYCKMHAQEMRSDVMQSHIDLYVNEYSLNLGTKGKETINFMLEKMKENRQIEEIPKDIFF